MSSKYRYDVTDHSDFNLYVKELINKDCKIFCTLEKSDKDNNYHKVYRMYAINENDELNYMLIKAESKDEINKLCKEDQGYYLGILELSESNTDTSESEFLDYVEEEVESSYCEDCGSELQPINEYTFWCNSCGEYKYL